MAGGRIDIEVDIDGKSVPGKLEKSLGPVGSFASKWGKRAGIAVGAAAGFAAAKTLTESFRGALDTQNTEASLKGLYGSAESAADMIQRVGNVSKTSPIDTSTYQKAATSLAYLGLKGQDSEDILRNVGLAITAAGGSSENMDRATLALTNMVNEGRVTRETLNQLSQAGVPVFTGLADAIGVSNEELTELISKGGVDLQDVLGVLQDGTGELFQQMIAGGKEAEKTFGNSFKAASNAVTDAIGNAMIPALTSLTPVLRTIGDEAPAMIATFSSKLGELGAAATDAFSQLRQSDLVQGSMMRLSGVFTQIVDTAREAGPAVGTIVQSLGEAAAATGISTWQVFLSLLESSAQILDATLVPALDTLASLMQNNQTLVNGLAVGFLALKTVPRIFGRISTSIMPARTMLRGFGDEMRLQQSLARMSGTELTRFGTVAATVQTRAVGAFKGITSSVRGLYSALGGLSGISIMGISAMLVGNASSAASAKSAQDALATSVADGARAQEELADSLGRTNGALDDQSLAAGARAVKGSLAEIVTIGERGHSSMENLGRAIDNVTGNVFGANDAWEEQYDHVSAMEGQYKELQTVMKSMKIDLDDVYKITAEGGPQFLDLLANLSALGGNGQKVAAQLRDAHNEIVTLQTAAASMTPGAQDLADAIGVLADKTSSASDRTTALRKALQAMGIIAPDARQAMFDVAKTVEEVSQSLNTGADAAGGLGDALLDQNGQLDATKSNARGLWTELGKLGEEYISAVGQGNDANAVWAQMGPVLDGLAAKYGLSADQVREFAAQQGLVQPEVITSIDVQGADEATQQLAGVQGMLDAAQRTGEDTITVQVDNQQALNALQTAGVEFEKTKNWKATGLVNIQVNDGASRARLNTLLHLVNSIPPGKRIDTSAPGAQGVINALGTIGIQVHQDNHKRIVIDDNSQGTIDKLNALNITTTTLDDGTVVITDNVPTVKTNVNSLNGLDTNSTHTVTINEVLGSRAFTGAGAFAWGSEHADGGAIRGPGGPTDDRILSALSNGEHVWTAAEVEAAGGQGAMYRMRAAVLGGSLPAFATGGAVERTEQFLRGESGKPYQYGGVGNPSWDCSGYSSAGYASLTGIDPYQRWYTTESDFASLGFRAGLDPSGQGMDIGVYNGGGGMYSHMSSALHGVPFESGSNGVIYGPGATPPSDGYFPNKYHLPTGAFVPPPSQETTSTSTSASTGTEPKAPAPPAPELTSRLGADEIEQRSLDLAVREARNRRNEAYADPASSPEDLLRADLALQRALNAIDDAKNETTAAGTDTEKSLGGRSAASIPELFGNAAKAAVSGQLQSALGTVGMGQTGGFVGALLSNADALQEASDKIAPAFSQMEIAKQGPVVPGSPGWLEELMKTIDVPMVLRDSGGPLPHGVAALNLSGENEWVQTGDQKRAQDAELAALRNGSGVSSRELGEMVQSLRELVANPPASPTYNAYGADPDEVLRRIEHKQHMATIGRRTGVFS